MNSLKLILITLLTGWAFLCAGQVSKTAVKTVGKLGSGAELSLKQNKSGDWGILVKSRGSSWVGQENPARISIFDRDNRVVVYNAGYQKIVQNAQGFIGSVNIIPTKGVTFHFQDHWTIAHNLIKIARTVKVTGNSDKQFTSALTLATGREYAWSDLRYFIPSVVYGYPGNTANAKPDRIEVRETALTAPVTGIYFNNGTSATMFNFFPKSDASDEINAGGMGLMALHSGGIEFGYGLPWGNPPSKKLWPADVNKAKGLHPIRDGFTQKYELALRMGRDERFHEYYTAVWRMAWEKLNPKIYHHDMEVVRQGLINMLADQVEDKDGRTGIPNFINWTLPPPNAQPNWKTTLRKSGGAIMGFTGKNLEAAVFMIMDAERGKSPLDDEHRQKGLKIIGSFLKLKMDPPVAEGFNLDSGEPMQAIPLERGFPSQLYLRSFGDDLKILLHGYQFEKQHGREHPEWLSWCKSFADWLLAQQYADGGFPRSWIPKTGEIRVGAPQSSYNAVPMLVLLGQITNDPKYRQAAEHAAEFCWSKYQVDDYYVGGTIDNPNVQDKEAASLSLEAYLSLYEDTKEPKWLLRAKAAADNAETYIYLWEYDGLPSIGTNKVTAAASPGGDLYMAFDVDEYAKLYKYTGDKHYYDVAKLLLHNTKAILGIPGRTFDLPGVGWQTEEAKYPIKGRQGNSTGHNLWLPWVSTAHLNGIMLLEQFDKELFKELCR